MEPLSRLIKELSKLPGIGVKSAGRLAYYITRLKAEEAFELANAIADAKKRIKYCPTCFNLTDNGICPVCLDDSRNKSIICVVEEPLDAEAIEKTHNYRGVYHVLHGAVSPLDGVGPDDLKINELLGRLKSGVKELIIATNPTTSGEATALYILKLAKPYNIKISRIAFGIPFGGDIEYVDKSTLSRSIEQRSTL